MASQQYILIQYQVSLSARPARGTNPRTVKAVFSRTNLRIALEEIEMIVPLEIPTDFVGDYQEGDLESLIWEIQLVSGRSIRIGNTDMSTITSAEDFSSFFIQSPLLTAEPTLGGVILSPIHTVITRGESETIASIVRIGAITRLNNYTVTAYTLDGKGDLLESRARYYDLRNARGRFIVEATEDIANTITILNVPSKPK